ncbi:MAG: PAS domain S-box protein [Methanomicrobiaceae archaeon]|nr:PAS domain S-box protein [Methanomicrobiaceae archaeon]
MVCGESIRDRTPSKPRTILPDSRLLQFIQKLDDAAVLIDENQNIITINPAMEDLFGLDSDTISGQSALHVLTTCISPLVERGEIFQGKIASAYVLGQDLKDVECRVVSPDDRGSWISYSSLILSQVPQGGMRVDIYRNISDFRKAEEALREVDRRYRLLAENARDVVWTMDMNLRFTYASPSIRRFLGYTPEETIGKRLEDVLTPDSAELVRKRCMEEMARKDSRKREVSWSLVVQFAGIRKKNIPEKVEVELAFLRDPDGRHVGILATAHDISERMQIERNIEQLATLGDQIRNPLAIIVGLADMSDDPSSEKIIEQALIIDEIITNLDRSCVESLKVREFVKKYYYMGRFIHS